MLLLLHCFVPGLLRIQVHVGLAVHVARGPECQLPTCYQAAHRIDWTVMVSGLRPALIRCAWQPHALLKHVLQPSSSTLGQQYSSVAQPGIAVLSSHVVSGRL